MPDCSAGAFALDVAAPASVDVPAPASAAPVAPSAGLLAGGVFNSAPAAPSGPPRWLAQYTAATQTAIQIAAVTIVMRVNTSPALAPNALEPPAPPNAPAKPPPPAALHEHEQNQEHGQKQ